MTKFKYLFKKIPGVNFVWDYISLNRLKKQDIESRFTNIFFKNGWGDENSLSGTGSNLVETEIVRQALEKLIKDLKIKTILDIPCGDFFWMKLVDLGEVQYVGADIVKPLIELNKTNYEGANRKFCQLDLIKDNLPTADLVICRDCLVHLSFEDIFKSIKNIKRSGSVYLLTTTFNKHTENGDIVTGRWRPLNLEMAPFNFPKPTLSVNEGCHEGDQFSDKTLALWRLSDLPISI